MRQPRPTDVRDAVGRARTLQKRTYEFGGLFFALLVLLFEIFSTLASPSSLLPKYENTAHTLAPIIALTTIIMVVLNGNSYDQGRACIEERKYRSFKPYADVFLVSKNVICNV